MRHLIDRVLELQEDEKSLTEDIEESKGETNQGDEELVELLAGRSSSNIIKKMS